MARAKKPKYEYVESLGLYRKRVKDATGKYVAVYGKTPEELTEKISDFIVTRELSSTGRKNMLVNDYIDQWLELHIANMTYGGKADYRSIVNKNIRPYMESRHMLEIQPDHIRELMLGVAGKSESVYKKTYMLLRQIFTSAYENGDILKNPCPKTTKGGVPEKGRTALTNEQVETLLEAVKETRVYYFCMIGLYAGLRREEILGLMWDCVHLDGTPRIEVKRALRFEHNQPVVSEKLKTAASNRVIPIPPMLVDCLLHLKEISISEYVIADRNGKPLSQTQFKQMWNAVVCRTVGERTVRKHVNGEMKTYIIHAKKGEKARHNKHYYTIDFPVTPHILRHTYITNLLLACVDIKTVQYLAGHEKSKITLDIYAHLTYNKPEEILKKVQTAFDEKREGRNEDNGESKEAKI